MKTQMLNENSRDAKERIANKQAKIRIAVLNATAASGPLTLEELVVHPVFKDMRDKHGLPLKPQSIRSRVPEMIKAGMLARTGTDKKIGGGTHYQFDVAWRVNTQQVQRELL